MNEFIKVLIERLEEIEKYQIRNTFGTRDNKDAVIYCTAIADAIAIVNQLAEEQKSISSIIADLKIFLQEKFDYCAEQSLMNLEAEGNSEIASYFRERKELYLDRANIYGEVMREIDRLAEETAKVHVVDDLAVIESLPSLYPLQSFEEEAIHRVVGNVDNNGWIPYVTGCDMPNEASRVWLSFTTPIASFVKSAWYINGHFEWDNCRRVKETPMAWKPFEIPAPYQPKGE